MCLNFLETFRLYGKLNSFEIPVNRDFSTASFISESYYRIFDTSKRFKRPVTKSYSPTTDAKNRCTNLTAKLFTKSKSNKQPYLSEHSHELICHCRTKVLSQKCFSLLQLLRALQRKWLSLHTSKWYDRGVKNIETWHRFKSTSKNNIDWFFQCVLSLSSRMLVTT